MHRVILLFSLSASCVFGQTAGAPSSYGSMKIPGNGKNGGINAKSNLARQAVVINDLLCPLSIKDARLQPNYDGDRLVYVVSGRVQAVKQATVRAFQLYYRLYDPIGNKIKDVYWPFVVDLNPNDAVDLKETFEFPADWLGEAKAAYLTVFWIGKVRVAVNGKEEVWEPGAVEAQIERTLTEVYPKLGHNDVK